MPDDYLNIEHLRDITCGNEELEARLFGMFHETATRCINALAQQTAISTQWKDACHELKGASANLGAVKLSQACTEAEHITDTAQMQTSLASIQAAYSNTRASIERL